MGLIEVFGVKTIETFYGRYYKMVLNNHRLSNPAPDSNIRRLGQKDTEKALRLYKKSYENNVFDPRMLETGKYF